MRVGLVYVVWRAVYGSRETVAQVDREVAIGYAILGSVFNLVLQPWQFALLSSRIRSGSVIFDMARPVGLIPICLAQQVGTTLAGTPKAVIGVSLGLLTGVLAAPGSLRATLAFILSAALGAIIAMLCNLLVAMSGFWTLESGGALIVYRMAASFCSGALIPLWLMPPALAGVLKWLPFSAQVFTPLSIYFDHRTGLHTLVQIGVQSLWVCLLLVLLRLVWHGAYRRVIINGG
jgi:ABC-type uncharacterized transport system permease subunit